MNIGFDLEGMSRDQLIKFATQVKNENEFLKNENRKKVSRLNNGKDLSSLGNALLAQKIIERLPTNTYETVNVTTIENYSFSGLVKTASKIELKREQKWTLVFDTPSAFFSTVFKSNSIYIRVLNETAIKQFLLDSSELNNNVLENVNKDIHAAYIQYKIIRIFVPTDCETEAEVEIESDSKIVKLSISTGKFLRSIFL